MNQQFTMQKITSIFSNMNWKTYLLIALVIGLLGYVIFNFYTTSSKAPFQANREGSDNEDSLKTANLMLFYVDWCPHCKTAKPEWDSLKEQYEGQMINGYTLMFSEYNCTNESPEVDELMNKYKIEGYPTIKLVKDKQVVEYDAKPTKSTLLEFLNTVL
jgi:thiol-disulfide isomerase/thioredoxin